MKKMSKIFAALAAMMTVCSSMPAIASAEEEFIDYCQFSTEYYREYNGVDIFTNGNPYKHYDKAYISNDNSQFMLLKKVKNIISFTPAEGVDCKDIDAALDGLLTEEGLAYYSMNDYYKKSDGTSYSIQTASEISENDAKEVYAALKDSGLVTELIFHNDRYRTEDWLVGGKTPGSEGVLTIYYDIPWTKPDELELVKEYFVSHNIQNYTVEDIYCIGENEIVYTVFHPDESVTFEDQLALTQDIAKEFGIAPGMRSGYGLSSYTSEAERFEINLLEYVEGDANLDSSLNLADSVAIMQSIANPDQYELTPQGKFNADIDGNGLTTGDALEIQKQLLNVK